MSSNIYEDAYFLSALKGCASAPVRVVTVRLDSLAVFLRCGAIQPMEVADELNEIGLHLLDLATAKQHRRQAA